MCRSKATEKSRISEEDIENLRQNLKEVEEAIDRQKDHLSEMNRDLSTMQMALTNYGALLKEYYKEIEEAQERKTALEEAIRKNVSDNALLDRRAGGATQGLFADLAGTAREPGTPQPWS